MVKSCLVSICKNTLGKPGITFHKIGKKRYADRLKAIGRSVDEGLSPQNVICSQHFAEADFIYFNGKKYLRLEALPRFLIPRRPPTGPTQIPSYPISQLPSEKNDSATYSLKSEVETADDKWLMYSNVKIHSSEDDNIDAIISQVNLSQYPTNEFLMSLMSENYESSEFSTSLEELEF